MNQLKRLLSIALSAAMLASAFPAFADDSSDTGAVGSQQEGTPDESNTDITVSLRFQRYGEHVSLPIEYTFDTTQRTSFAEYGFGDEMTAVEQDGSVTPMHLLAEHYFQTVLGADDSLISSVADPETGLKTEGLFLIDYMSSKADSQTAFMFTVNNEIPSNEETGIQYSMPEYSLKDGDEVVIYEGWGGIWSETDPLDTYYTYFTDDTAETVAGDGITLELDGFGIYGMTEMPIEGAQLEAALLTEGEEPVFEDIPDAVTDSDGQAIISFDRAGTYLVSAYRVSDYFLTSGPYAEDISRPLCIVTVSDDTVESYLPAPGQFVNLPEYSDPEKALIEKTGDIITLGSFGGSIVYKFASPIRNDEKNPYGIDFVIYGNAFANADGQTSQSAGVTYRFPLGQPAPVMETIC